MRIAFLCLAHTGQTYLERVAKYYLSDDDGLFIHIDRRSDLNRERLRDIGAHVLDKQVSFETRWAGFALVEATLKLMKLAADLGYDRYVLVSGSDIPIKNKLKLKNSLSESEIKWCVGAELVRLIVAQIALNGVTFLSDIIMTKVFLIRVSQALKMLF